MARKQRACLFKRDKFSMSTQSLLLAVLSLRARTRQRQRQKALKVASAPGRPRTPLQASPFAPSATFVSFLSLLSSLFGGWLGTGNVLLAHSSAHLQLEFELKKAQEGKSERKLNGNFHWEAN